MRPCSGDCGVFALKYVEHKVLDLPLSYITDENMNVFRQRWAADLFAQSINI